MNHRNTRPIKIVIGAMGGEGGGLLTQWMADLCESQNFEVRYTYVPGVAQRTGATTYYLEAWPAFSDHNTNQSMVCALMPCPGDVDLLLSTEAVEAGRALQAGFITRSRTTVISSSHRAYAVAEKIAPGDARIDPEFLLKTVATHCQRLVQFDMAACAAAAGSIINAVLFGAVAGAGVLPFSRQAFIATIQRSSTVAAPNLAGFDLGYAMASDESKDLPGAITAAKSTRSKPTAQALAAMEDMFPPDIHDLLRMTMERLVDYQDDTYAKLYLDRLQTVLEVDRANGGKSRDYTLTRETGRWLARLMTYDDIIRVADLKTRRQRFIRLREEVSAFEHQVVHVADYLKPGLEEFVSILSPKLAKWVRSFSARTGFGVNGFPIKIKTSTVSGFLALRIIAGLRSRRTRSSRYLKEQATIEDWLAQLLGAARRDYGLALEVAACAGLIKGYGQTHLHSAGRFRAILEKIPKADADTLRRLREAAQEPRL
ncbi:MAG: indolepyruvate oxidoreductase subunit B [Acidiferrobacteraceae bacterium]|jgi:indolepyruvate ferredoxin oxidoreductase beta subunit|nr:indolepyruvate oxidoreductase subunit B [Acidiferrobacteraceae bacterium]HJP07468.1 indolepyruvate oxidoreductase subunit beta family protein [Arenicellales bacterium]|tara:strand:- start:5720 stop:7174 length:1455 start_codon:yes stop_codon:yes gene_type:complete